MRLRPFAIALAACIPGCSSPVVYIPAPWEQSEPRNAEPSSLTPPVPMPPKWTRIGASVRGKPLQACTIGSGARRIYIIGGIHGDEPEAPAVASLLPELLTLSQESVAHSTIRILRDMNPDGGAARTRTNTRRVDLERNWPAKDFLKDDRSGDRPLSELETASVHADMMAFKPDIVIVLQSANLPPSVAAYGATPRLGHEFASAARKVDPRWRFNPSPRPRVPGSIESLFGAEMGMPVIRVELQRNRSAEPDAQAIVAGLFALDTQPATAPGGSASTAAAKPG